MSDTFIPRPRNESCSFAVLRPNRQGKPWINPYPDYVLFDAVEAKGVPPAHATCMFCKEAKAIVSRIKRTHTGTGAHCGYRYCAECLSIN